MGNLTNPTYVSAVLKRFGFTFQKKYGQNFLIDDNILSKIIENADIRKGDVVLEIGPGIGTMTEEPIEVIYYYRKKATNVTVHYYEEGTTNKVSENVVIEGRVDDPYTTKPATDVPIKYELSIIPDNAEGTMTLAPIEVIYYYRVKDAQVNVRYIDKATGQEITEQDILKGKVDDEYQTTPKDIMNYTLVEHSGNTSGRYEVEPITVTYYYLQNTRATVQYIDKITGLVIEEETQEGLEGDWFETASRNFDGYVLVEEPEVKKVQMTKDHIILKYYYIHVSAGVIEKHVDIITGEILENTVHEGKVGDPYEVYSKVFEGYDLVEEHLPQNSKGTMELDPIEVVYYYKHKAQVTVKYIDKVTGEEIEVPTIIPGHEKDPYTTEGKDIPDYVLDGIPENATGEMTVDPTEVIYYYKHTSAGVKVNYIDIKTGEKLADEIVFTGEGNNKEVTLGTEDGSCVIENAKDVSLKINGEEKGFTVQKGNVVIEE